MIQAENIFKAYGNVNVLSGVSLCTKKQEIVAITGPSGAGKTTLLHLLGTLDRPDRQKNSVLKINGIDVLGLKNKAMAHFRSEHIGFIFQFHELLPEFTAIENVCIPAWIAKEKSKTTRLRAQELLTLLGLENRMQHKPAALSGGEQQRVAVARALMNKPSLVFADEPSGNLDSKNATLLHDLFFTLRDQIDCSFIIVTHNTQLAKRADRIISLKDGKIQK